MRALIVGAGASYAEALEAGLGPELRPPLISNFARRLWSEYNPHFLLSAYLHGLGHDPGADARDKFLELEATETDAVNVERFFAFAHQLRGCVLPAHEGFSPSSEYDNLLLHGILSPLTFLLQQGLFSGTVGGAVKLPLATKVAGLLEPTDLVVNLNYDTIFEIGAQNAGHQLAFIPNRRGSDELAIAKPHGSINLFVDKDRHSFWFAKPLFAGTMQPDGGARNYSGFVPPRFGKSYAQHPIANAIVGAIRNVAPSILTFWGIGLTDSDTDLLELFSGWAQSASIEFINPDKTAAERASLLLGADVRQFDSVEEWASCC